MPFKKSVIIVCGPTAVGKTKAAIDIALNLGTEIISADSRQCYRELNIGVAKPSGEQLEMVKHHFINSHSIVDELNAVAFGQYALNAVNEIFEKHDTAVMVGGTGLYIKAFCNGLDEIPAVDPGIRKNLMLDYQQQGLTWLQQQISKLDPVFWAQADQQNPVRLLRALEVHLSSGKSITCFKTGNSVYRNFNIYKFGLELPRPELYFHINTRVDAMIAEGLPAEVAALLPFRKFNALQTVGYRELFDYLDGNASRDAAIDNIKTNTRHYAKRQMTWFKKDREINWQNAHNDVAARILHSISSISNNN